VRADIVACKDKLLRKLDELMAKERRPMDE